MTCGFSSAPAASQRRGTAAADGVGESKRQEMKLLLRELKKTNPNIEKSMFRAIHGVQLDTVPGLQIPGHGPFAFPEAYDLRGASSAEDRSGGFDTERGTTDELLSL